MPAPRPPGVSERAFQSALTAFRSVVGAAFVFTSDDERWSYTDPFSIGDPLEHEPSAAVAPKSVEEVQAVVRAAARYGVPLWPVSMGKNFAYGGAAPRQKGTVVLDLKRMNRVLEIDEEVGYALVEPGVSFFDFHKALQGKRVWMSGPAHSWGSVIGNALEHGVGYTPYGQHAETICGMEVVLANGDLVRTGQGAVAGSKEWNAYRHGYGPVWDGVFTQSNFGIVTKMGVWLMPEPEGMAGVRVSVPDETQLELLVDTLRPLRLDDTINATYTLANGMRQASRIGTRAKLYKGRDAVPPDVIGRQLAAQGDGWWNASWLMFDRPEILDLKLARIREAFANLPGARFAPVQRWRRGQPMQPWMRQDLSLGPLGVVDWHGGRGGHTDFGPVMAPVGKRVREVYDVVMRGYYKHGIDPYVGMFGLGQRSVVMVADIFYDRDDRDMVERARALFRDLCEETAKIGVGLYRAHITFMDEAAAMQGFNDHALMRLNRAVKAALDPKGILAPGKQGIWPERKP